MMKYFKNNEEGIALVFTLLTFLVLAMLGTALMTIGVANVKLTKATAQHESTFYIAEGGINQSIAILEKQAKELGAMNLSHDDFFNQLEAFIDENIQGELDIFEENAGEEPIAVIDVTKETAVNQTVGNYSQRSVRYTLESTGQQGSADRTVSSSFDLAHRIKVATSGNRGVMDYLLYSESNHTVDLTGGGYYEGDLYAKDVNIRASNTDFRGSIISEKGIAISSSSKIAGDLIALGGNVNLSASNNAVDGDIHASGDVQLSSGTEASNIFSKGLVDLSGGNEVKGDIHSIGNVKLGYGTNTQHVFSGGSLIWSGNNSILGEIHAQENVGESDSEPSDITVNGHVFSGQNVYTVAYNRYIFRQDVHAGNDIRLGTDNKIEGNAYAGQQIIGDGIILGSRYVESEVEEPIFPTLPDYKGYTPMENKIALSEFEYGSKKENINQTVTLEPGAYGEVKINGSGEVILKSGDYYFESLSSVPHTGVKFDITNGPINVYVAENVDIKTDLEFHVKKGNRDVMIDRNFISHHLDEVKSYAGDIYFETHGNFTLPESSNFIGSIIVNNDFTVGNSSTLVGTFAVKEGKINIRDYGPQLYYAPPKRSAGTDYVTGGSDASGEMLPVEMINTVPVSEQ
ncbi:hypothetical protein HMI01_03350 [Halolactibacillus miurensis]|uniref:PilX N-terminal n=1 Tax=Halolactibacillus miurensis TaxID=306541 RepID=A0ABQ0VQB7_9BACI|nr:hypothetical protein HMI01_03350 [Halolactibacillus miurensis]